MEKSRDLFAVLKANRIIALLSAKNAEQCLKAYELFRPLSITLEIAFRSEYAVEGIHSVVDKYPDALVLAGTVMTSRQAELAIEAGSAGIVSADYIPAVVEKCAEKDIMCVPGGLSDAGKQLAQKAEIYGCDLEELRIKYPYQWIYKLFPAVSGGKSNMALAEAWRGPFKDLTVIYTGGINSANLALLNSQDKEGIFCGSSLTKDIDNSESAPAEANKWVEIMNMPARNIKRDTKKLDKFKMKSKKVVTFGEIMLRLSPPDYERFAQAKSFDIHFGGAEANAAVAFANYGFNSIFVSALPENDIGQTAINALRSYGVNTDWIIRQGERIGIYYYERGASQRPSKVIYDRKGSSISQIKPGAINWKRIFEGADWFHWSGITPALSDSLNEVLLEALSAAKEAEVKVSVDLNYRKKLWDKARAGSVMNELMHYVDVCIGNEEDAECFFGIKAKSTDLDTGIIAEDEYKYVAEELLNRFGLSLVAITLRKSISASENEWSACLYNGNEFKISRNYRIQIVDRVGGGDSFASGLIYGLLSGMADGEALEFGTAASCLKQTIPGDFNLVSVSEVEALMAGATSGRVQR